MLGLNKIWFQQKFGSTKLQKNLWSKKILDKKYVVQKNLDSKDILCQNEFLVNKILNSKKFSSQKIWAPPPPPLREKNLQK